MNLFDQLVTEALKHQPDLFSLRVAVEKELLHHDILRILSHHQLLSNLTFMGGTCLRLCYGGTRLSEDLDFTGGCNFSRSELSTLGKILTDELHEKYNLFIKVNEPVEDKKNVDTWKVRIETRPEQKHFPSQHINIDICAVSSYEKRPMMLLNPYGVDMGTNGLIIQVQSREEIYADKLIAFALRPNRLKYRDLWDIIWLHQQGLKPQYALIPYKLADRHLMLNDFLCLFEERKKLLTTDKKMSSEFKQEMQRFLPMVQLNQILQQDDTWKFIIYLMDELFVSIQKVI